MEKSFRVLQEKLQEMAEEGHLPSDTKESYGMRLKILEGHYMNLFKSREYTDALHRTLNSSRISSLPKMAMRDFLQLMPVVTHRIWMTAYEFHLLKKRVRELEKKINVLQKSQMVEQ